MKLLLRVRLLMVIVTTSYVTLGVAAASEAERLWAPYAAVTFALALLNLWIDRDC